MLKEIESSPYYFFAIRLMSIGAMLTAHTFGGILLLFYPPLLHSLVPAADVCVRACVRVRVRVRAYMLQGI